MEASKSNPNKDNEDDDDPFFDAYDEFPFYDCSDRDDPDQSFSTESKPSPEMSSPTGLRRRRSSSRRTRRDVSGDGSQNPNPNSPVSPEVNQIGIPRDRKLRFSRNSKENEAQSEISDSFRVRFDSGDVSHSVNDENSVITATGNDRIDDSGSVDSRPREIEESSSNLLFLLAALVIRAVGFQLSLLVRFFTFPIRILYCLYLFVIDPFRIVRRGRDCLMRKLFGVWGVIYESVWRFVYEWLKEHKSIWKFSLRFGWGLLWSMYVCFILVGLLVSAFVFSGFVMRFLVEKPIQMKETLTFDYTQNSPVALVPITSCPEGTCGEKCSEYIEMRKHGATRGVPPNHKLRVTVSLTLPESDYNRNLGVFQVRVDFLSANGKAIASSRQPCMLQFKSPPIRLLLTFLKIAPLLSGYQSESQTLNIAFKGFTEQDIPTTCLRVTVEQRAEYRPGAGIPEIYASLLTLESELPLFKRILWYWKKTVFIWTSMMIFTIELLFTLICCNPIIMPRARLRNSSPRNNAPPNGHPVQM